MAIRVIDDSKLQNIAVAIQGKDGGGQMTVDEMPPRIAEIPTGGGSVEEKDVNFYDWEGTLLFGYSVEEVRGMTSLPAPDTSPNYQTVDHDLLVFQEWNWNLTNIKSWVQNHSDQSLGVGAIYTTTDLQNHNYRNNPRLTNAKSIYMQKRGATSIGDNAFAYCNSLTAINVPDGVISIGGSAFYNCYSLTGINIPDGVTSIGNNAFAYCYSLTAINIPDGVTSIGGSAFYNCYSLTGINIPDGVTSIDTNAFQGCRELYDVVIHGKPALSNTNAFSGAPSTQKLYVHRSDLSWFETATNWSTIYAQGKIVAAADYLDHLISIGIDVTDFENEVITT